MVNTKYQIDPVQSHHIMVVKLWYLMWYPFVCGLMWPFHILSVFPSFFSCALVLCIVVCWIRHHNLVFSVQRWKRIHIQLNQIKHNQLVWIAETQHENASIRICWYLLKMIFHQFDLIKLFLQSNVMPIKKSTFNIFLFFSKCLFLPSFDEFQSIHFDDERKNHEI